MTVLGLAGGCAGAQDPKATAPVIQAAPQMTFAECQASATYPGGGQYAVSYDHGVCTVQKP